MKSTLPLVALTLLGAALAWRGPFAPRAAADESTRLPEGWTTGTPRTELRPEFEHLATGGWSDCVPRGWP